MDPNRLVLLIGAPRSGTTWRQGILSGHPSVVSPQETDLFSRFIEPLAQAWDWQTRDAPEEGQQRRFKGLPCVFDEVAGDLLVELGYEPDRSWASGTTTHRAKSKTRVIASRGLRSAAARIGSLASRIEANSSETP